MKLAIIGSRTFDDFDKGLEVFSTNFATRGVTEIVSGGAIGADSIGKRLAWHLRLNYTPFYPEWEKYGRSAGFKRNITIITHCDEVLAFWDGISRGTKNSIDIATQQGKPVFIHIFTPTVNPTENSWADFGL